MAQAPPKAGAKDLSYNSLNLIHEFLSLFSPKVIVAGLPRESFPTEVCLSGHQCFSVVAQGLFSNERTWFEPLKPLSWWMKGGESWMPTCEETACCHSAPGETWKVTLDNLQCGAYLSTIFAWVQWSVPICANQLFIRLIMSWKLSDLF